MFGYGTQPFIIQMPSPPPPTMTSGGPPPNPAEQIKQQIEGLTQLAAVFEEVSKKGKKDEKPKSGPNVDWRSLAQLLFWTSPVTGLAMLHVYAALFTAMKNGVKPFIQ